MPSPKTHRRIAAVIAAAALGAWPLTLSFASTPSTLTSPGTFQGWAFDACAAPSAKTMDAWLKDKTNPYRGIGIYISGALRACSQPNLTADWVSHVQQTGWHLLPLTVGPQASCTGFSQVISDSPANNFAAARKQGAAQADDAVAHAQALGISAGSTLFYDMENWHTGYNNCDASTLWFMSAWTNRLHSYGYAGGTYVSGLSGARLLNAMANTTPSGFVLPDQIWIAEWNNQENTKSNYVDAANWANHQRAHQYYGGHNATNSKITLNIDSNYVDLRPVFPIPAVVPDSAIGAPLPLPLPSPSASPSTTAPTPSANATSPVTTQPPSGAATPTTAPPTTPSARPTPTPTASATRSTGIAAPVTPTSAPPSARSTTPAVKAPVPTVKPSAKPAAKPAAKTPEHAKKAATVTPAKPKKVTGKSSKKATKPAKKKSAQKSLTSTVNDATSQLGSATGIKLPTLPAARVLEPKLADRVPTMVTPPRQTRTHSASSPKASATPPSATPTTSAPMPIHTAQAAPLQPSMPYTAPQIAQEPSLITKIWHGTEGVLLTIGHALGAAAAWVGRGFGSMLGW